MAKKKQETVTLKISARLVSLTEMQFLCDHHVESVDEPAYNILQYVSKLNRILNTHGITRFNMVSKDISPGKLLQQIMEKFIELLEETRSNAIYLENGKIYVCSGLYYLGIYGGLQIYNVDRLRGKDPELFGIMCRILKTLRVRYGYQRLDEYSYFEVIDDGIDERIAMAEDEEEGVNVLENVRDEIHQVRTGEYRALMDYIDGEKPMTNEEMQNLMNRIRAQEFHHNSARHKILKELYLTLSYLVSIRLMQEPQLYALDFEEPLEEAKDEYFRLSDNFVINWRYGTDLWCEIGFYIDDMFNNYGIEPMADSREITDRLPDEQENYNRSTLEYDFEKFKKALEHLKELYNADEYFNTYLKQIEKNGKNYQKILDKGRTLVGILSV